MQLVKAGQAEQIVTCIGSGIAFGIKQAKAGVWDGKFKAHLLSENTREMPSAFWVWEGAVVRVGLQHLLRRIGPGYLVRENTGEIYFDEEEKGSCVDPLYSVDPTPSEYRGRE